MDSGAKLRLVTTVCLASSSTTVVAAGMSYLILPMLDDLQLTLDQASGALAIPSIGALLVVFIAGVMAQRFGDRRSLLFAALAYLFGCAVMSTAPNLPLVTFGLLMVSTSGVTLSVVALGMLSARIGDTRDRATAFATLGIVVPVVFITVPVLAGIITQISSWRWIPVIWACLSVLIVLSTWLLLRPTLTPTTGKPIELMTPLLAGIFMAGVLQVFNHWSLGGIASPRVWIPLVGATLALALFVWTRRRLSHPSLSLVPLTSRSTWPLIVAFLVFPLANTFFFITVGWQYLFGLNALQTALIMIPLQLTCVVGAKFVAGPVVQRWGLSRGGVGLICLYIVFTFGLLAVQDASSIWITAVITSLWAGSFTAVTVVLNNAMMSSQPPRFAGNVSAYQKASGAVSGTLSAVLIGPLVLVAIGTAMETKLLAGGASSASAESLRDDIQSSTSHAEQLRIYSYNIPGDKELEELHKESLIVGLRTDALLGGVLGFATLGLFMFARPGGNPELDRGGARIRRDIHSGVPPES